MAVDKKNDEVVNYLNSVPEWGDFFVNELESVNALESKPLGSDPKNPQPEDEDDDDSNFGFLRKLKSYNGKDQYQDIVQGLEEDDDDDKEFKDAEEDLDQEYDYSDSKAADPERAEDTMNYRSLDRVKADDDPFESFKAPLTMEDFDDEQHSSPIKEPIREIEVAEETLNPEPGSAEFYANNFWRVDPSSDDLSLEEMMKDL